MLLRAVVAGVLDGGVEGRFQCRGATSTPGGTSS
jgi:hypothetical protein